MPNQSAMRIIVPKFPGSCIPANAKQRLFRGREAMDLSASASHEGISKMAMPPRGERNNDKRSRSACLTVSTNFAFRSKLGLAACKKSSVA